MIDVKGDLFIALQTNTNSIKSMFGNSVDGCLGVTPSRRPIDFSPA